ncbi:lytic murein transglycosylase B [Pusillimonas sp. MFBS29]|uniref:lytic murein transglycosylase B n=1 Tax=Pusillimonas sp. MFBS29 TaxID=2886690 RepID=UPI001D0FFE4C|nr:lytic murein transglycosylase B [Pusillimonas sp. MFBS29]MCC2595257.1 lytic murein transglycosylase B [Pusillimonas sp. MFBS29]
MFKPVRILQVTCLNLLLVGCAATHTGPSSGETAAPPAPIDTSTTAAPGALPLTIPEPSPSIQAGQSTPGNASFVQPDGQLTPNIQAYAHEVASARGIPLNHVESLLKLASYDAAAAKLMTPSRTRIRRSWVTYRNRFVEPIRIEAGTEFWTANKAKLDETASTYGVPASIIVAIIGVETIYGRITGNFRVLDALATLGFRHPDTARPERSQLFRDQLADLIELDYQNKLDANLAQGSFAGAMGLPQFMPGSLMRYAADGDNDGRIDLLYSVDDAIVSVARFLRLHGWVPGLPVFAPVTLPANAKAMVAGGLFPTLSWTQLHDQGARLRPAQGNATSDGASQDWMRHKLGVVDLLDEPRNQAEYRVGTPNFFAITHYNRSYFYATSVADLAQALADRMGYGGPN